MTELWCSSAAALASRFRAGTASPVEALDSVLTRIAEVDDTVRAFTSIQEEDARRRAAELTEELRHGHDRGPLHGVPVAIKELFDVAGAPGDYGSNALSGRIAEADAHLVRRLRRAGAVVVGTTRSHEFGWGITTQHQRRGGTRNPWNLERVPGGSSGGSGAAVATGMVPIAVGSDTGGSIRIPSSFCGVAGLKPTFGLIGRTGGVALAPSFDTPGALARTIQDAATLVSVMSGGDPDDPACDGRTFTPPEHTATSLDGTRVGLADSLIDVELDSGVARTRQQALEALASLGAELVSVELPTASTMLETFVPLQMAEAHHVHNQDLGLYPGRSADYGDDVRSRLDLASAVSIGDYLAARHERNRIIASFDRAMSSVDVILSPISAVGPSLVDNPDEGYVNGDPRPLRDLVMRFTVPQNLTGLPTSIVRAGFDSDGLPVGVQITAGRWKEGTAVAVAGALQAALGPIDLVPVPGQPDGR